MSKSIGILGRQVTGSRAVGVSTPSINTTASIAAGSRKDITNTSSTVKTSSLSKGLTHVPSRSISIKDAEQYLTTLKSEAVETRTDEQMLQDAEDMMKDVGTFARPEIDGEYQEDEEDADPLYDKNYRSDDDTYLQNTDPSLIAFREQFPDEYNSFFSRLNQNVIDNQEMLQDNTYDYNAPAQIDGTDLLDVVEDNDPFVHLRNAKMLAEYVFMS